MRNGIRNGDLKGEGLPEVQNMWGHGENLAHCE